MSGGHVFVVRGDLTKLACDAWLVPCADDRRSPGVAWAPAVAPRARLEAPLPHRGVRAAPIPARAEGLPQPILTNAAANEGTELAWFFDGVKSFLEVARGLVKTPARRRARPLFGVNFVGTGKGGAQKRAGEVARDYIPILLEQARAHEIDIAVVEPGAGKYAALQAARRLHADEAWADLDPALLERADEIGEEARAGRLVPFIGAGLGRAVGFPGWDELLRSLAKEHADIDDEEFATLEDMSPLEKAALLDRAIGQRGGDLNTLVASTFDPPNPIYPLAYAFVAAMGCREAITTNYDELYEQAARSVHLGRAGKDENQEIAVLPFNATGQHARWLLKLHGCVTEPESIVLTRKQYFDARKLQAALFGVVQAMLITKRLLFIGYSLTDPDFLEVMEEVRAAVRGRNAPEASSGFGYVLSLEERPRFDQLWSGDLHVLPMLGPGADTPDAARKLEIFLDRVATVASDHGQHLLGENFEGTWTPAELALRAHLQAFLTEADAIPGVEETAAWQRIRALARSLGHTE